MLIPTDFQAAFIEALLWSSTDDDGTPLDRDHGAEDFAPDAMAKLMADCAAFEERWGAEIDAADRPRASRDYTAREQAGHDFALTRNRHGAGFWDGDWPDPLATQLTDASHEAGEVSVYIGDDGKLYI